MKLIKPCCEILEQLPGLSGVYKQIEFAGRTCYKSHDKITSDSAKEFVDRMIKSGHGAMLEHGTVYLHMEFESKAAYFNDELALKYHENPHSRALRVRDNVNDAIGKQHSYITTNLRVLVENGWMDDLKYICEPTKYHSKRVTVKFICDRGVSHEFVRHRTFSFAQESTRYCNYSKDKFRNEVTYILPPWVEEEKLPLRFGYSEDKWGKVLLEYYFEASDFGKEDGLVVDPTRTFMYSLQAAEQLYFSLLRSGWKAQEARAVLPNALKTELVMTGFVDDWKHFFELRTPTSAHPQARELAQPLLEEFINLNYITWEK